MNKQLLTLLTTEIKLKKQLSSFDSKYIENKLNKYFLTNGDIRKKLEKEFETKEKINKSKIFKQVIKDIRQEIGQVYGQFLTNKNSKKYKLLKKNNTDELLDLHKSTRERKDYYEEIYDKIFEWYKPKKILDIACGYNPCSYSLMKIKPDYFAIDLNKEDMDFLNEFFKKYKIKGKAQNYDVTKLDFIEEIKDCDLVFLFKALDSFEEIKKNISKKLLVKLPQKFVVVSFPTKSLISKKEFREERRNWFKNYLEKQNWKIKNFEVENEIFFLIEKN